MLHINVVAFRGAYDRTRPPTSSIFRQCVRSPFYGYKDFIIENRMSVTFYTAYHMFCGEYFHIARQHANAVLEAAEQTFLFAPYLLSLTFFEKYCAYVYIVKFRRATGSIPELHSIDQFIRYVRRIINLTPYDLAVSNELHYPTLDHSCETIDYHTSSWNI